MIKRIRHKDLRFLWAILAILFLFGAPRLVGAFQSSADIQRLYAEIEGDYEFYFGSRETLGTESR
jgi:hypothetical protein